MTDPLEHRRKEAMKRYLEGEKLEDVCRALSCIIMVRLLFLWFIRFVIST